MGKNYIKNFVVYLSDYLSFILFVITTCCILYFFIFDTTFLGSFGIFENELLLGLVSATASIEIIALFLSYYYFKLKKIIYFSRIDDRQVNLQNVLRFIFLRFISFFIKIISCFVFFSPFLLSLSSIALLTENGVSQKVFYILSAGSVLLFISAFLSYSVFIQKLSFLHFCFIEHPFMSYRKLYELSSENADGNLFSLFKLKLKNIPKKIASVFIIPAIYYLPSCLFDVNNFLYEKSNPYPQKVNTEKTVVFYFEPIKEN